MAILTREAFLDLKDSLLGEHTTYVEVAPDLEVKVVQLTAEGAFAVMDNGGDDDLTEKQRFRRSSYRWAAACCVDEDGNQVFTVEDLEKLPYQLLMKLVQAVNRVNGLSNPEAIDEAEKNSEEALS